MNGQSLSLTGTGDFLTCRRRLDRLISDPCSKWSSNTTLTPVPCVFEELSKTRIAFEGTEFYGFSEFYYSLNDVLGLSGDYVYDLVRAKATAYCETNWSVIQERKANKLYAQAKDNRLQSQCFKCAWVTSVLHSGLKMPNGYGSFHTIFSIKGHLVQWTLGALLFRTRLTVPIEERNVLRATMSFSSSPLTIQLFFFIAIIVISIVVFLRHLNKLSSPIGKAEVELLMEVATATWSPPRHLFHSLFSFWCPFSLLLPSFPSHTIVHCHNIWRSKLQ